MHSVKIKLFKGKNLRNGHHPVVLQVIDNRKTHRISLGIKARQEEWVEELGRFSKENRSWRKQNQVLEHFELKAEKIQSDLVLEGKPFSFELFRSRFTAGKKQTGVLAYLEKHVTRLKDQGKLSSHSNYRSTLSVLRQFLDGKEISFYSIDYEFLVELEGYLFARGCSPGGINHHMRNIRAIFNDAIRREYCEASYYPFSDKHNANGYSLSRVKSKAKPRALSELELTRLKALDITDYPHLMDSYNYFLFSYYTRGMNFGDMARLKNQSIMGGRIVYRRKKTDTEFSIKVTPEIKSILGYFKQAETDYVFPILDLSHQTELQQRNRIHKCLRKLNLDLREIGQLIDCSVPLTSYVARHSWASMLKKKGVSTELISEGLGHSEITTTKAYLSNFNQDELDQTASVL